MSTNSDATSSYNKNGMEQEIVSSRLTRGEYLNTYAD